MTKLIPNEHEFEYPAGTLVGDGERLNYYACQLAREISQTPPVRQLLAFDHFVLRTLARALQRLAK